MVALFYFIKPCEDIGLKLDAIYVRDRMFKCEVSEGYDVSGLQGL